MPAVIVDTSSMVIFANSTARRELAADEAIDGRPIIEVAQLTVVRYLDKPPS